MSSVRSLHDKAMELAQQAMVARYSGESERANDLAHRAYQPEAEAADLVPGNRSSEPTRAILCRSAASLAYECEDLKGAQRLAAKGLSGYPPADVEAELRTILAQVDFRTNLLTRSMRLEIQ